MAEWLALPVSDHEVVGSNLAEGQVLFKPKQRFMIQKNFNGSNTFGTMKICLRHG